ncbi:LysR family transcriptional regulator [Pseudonocardia sp. WMMC193]|uniref:LysR family transcriptional regulator n=1 Tax=Pseudonocardia sp. WMMC193 TaxID=2911965 RepID=UPI001F1956CF|nr:LysR family transcriptional regulator [Pseudonocardia sp. WMMC193]MCF7553260.1 LysR family transcriptional regulator [Pseudonocardia sp. WMMC193]
MTLTQLSAFVLVARLGSVRAAATTLGVSEPAVSQAISALRRHFGDQLLIRGENGMVLTAGGQRLVGIAAQMVGLGAEAESAVRSAHGAPERLRLIAPSDVVEFVSGPLAEAFGERAGGRVETTSGVAGVAEMAALLSQRLADVALGPQLTDRSLGLVSEPIFRCRLVVLTGPGAPPSGAPTRWPWLVDPSGADRDGEVGRLLNRLGVPETRLRVFPNQTAAWEAAARGDGVAPGIAHLAAHQLRRGELQVVELAGTPTETCWYATTLPPERRSAAAGSLRRFLDTPDAMRLLRAPGAGVPPSRFTPPVYVTIWS